MRTVNLGRTGLKVTEVCLGTMTFGNQADQKTAFSIMDVADGAGINFIDTADVYPLGGGPELVGTTEEIVGRWLKERRARERIVLATKCRGRMGPGANDEGLSRKHILRACEDSLKRLQTDNIDLYQTHQVDETAPIEETLRAMEDLVRSGKVRYIGCSNYQSWQLGEALWASDKLGLSRFDSVQPRYNILFRVIEEELVPLCVKRGVGIIVYNPLGGGMLTGRYTGKEDLQQGTRFTLRGAGAMYQKRYWNDAVFGAVEELKQLFTARGKSLTHVALAWVLGRPGITSAIVGASKPEQLQDSLKGVGLTLDRAELEACEEIWFNLPRERDPQVARR